MLGNFLNVFARGIWQIDCWDRESSWSPAPRPPRMPAYPRPSRALPPEIPEWQVLHQELTEAQRVLLDDCRDNGLVEELRETWSPLGDPDCLEGWILMAELLPERLDQEGTPDWWQPEEYDRATADALWDALVRAERRIAENQRQRSEQIRAIQTAPETDPAWAGYDAALAAHPAQLAAYWERVRAECRKATGYPSKEAAAAAYWATHEYTASHALLGYEPPPTVGAIIAAVVAEELVHEFAGAGGSP